MKFLWTVIIFIALTNSAFGEVKRSCSSSNHRVYGTVITLNGTIEYHETKLPLDNIIASGRHNGIIDFPHVARRRACRTASKLAVDALARKSKYELGHYLCRVVPSKKVRIELVKSDAWHGSENNSSEKHIALGWINCEWDKKCATSRKNIENYGTGHNCGGDKISSYSVFYNLKRGYCTPVQGLVCNDRYFSTLFNGSKSRKMNHRECKNTCESYKKEKYNP